MNAAQIGELAYNAGIRNQSDLQAAIAIALAESSGNPNAIGDVGLQNATWGPSVGLWQIRSLKAESGKGTDRDATKLRDPANNATSMFNISNGGKNWKPWTTWPLRASVYMPIASPAATGILAGKKASDVATDVGSGVADALVPDSVEAVGEGIAATASWVSNRENWFRVAKVVIGGVLVVGGVFLAARPVVSPAVAKAGKIAGKVL